MSGSFGSQDSPDPSRDLKMMSHDAPSHGLTEEQQIASCLENPPYEWHTSLGKTWIYRTMDDTNYNHNGRPNDPRPSCGGTNYGLQPPRSYHPNLVHVLFGDGHVEPVAATIDIAVWRSLGTYNRGD